MTTPSKLLSAYVTQSQMSSFFIDKLGMVSVDSYGAKGDGTTDDSEAFSDALSALNDEGGGMLFIPAKTYYHSSALTISYDNITIVGCGDSSEILCQTGVAVSGDNVKIFNLKIRTTGTSYHFGVEFVSGARYGLLENCRIDSNYGGVRTNDSNYSVSARDITIRNNWINAKSNGGVVGRISLDGVAGQNIRVEGNTIINDGSSMVGIELWADNSKIVNNRVYSSGYDGGYSGIVVGLYSNQLIQGNYVEGFSAGVEVSIAYPDSDYFSKVIVDSNIIYHCIQGIIVSGTYKEEDVIISNNNISMSYDNVTPTMGISLKCRYATLTNNIIQHETDLAYTDSDSRKCAGIKANTSTVSLNIIGCIFHNLDTGLTIGATSGRHTISNCTFNNVKLVSDQVGGNPEYYFSNCSFHNIGYHRANNFISIVGCSFYNEDDFTYINKPFVNSYNTNYVKVINKDNSFNNVLYTCNASDGSYIDSGSGYGRPDFEYINESIQVPNYSGWYAIADLFNTAGETIPYDVDIYTYSDGKRFKKTKQGIITYANASPSTASHTFTIGDLVYNTEPAPTEYIGWVCTTSGTLGTLNSGTTTGSITNGSNELTVNSASGLFYGAYISIAGVSGTKKVTNVSGTTITIDSNANATVSDVAIAYVNPVFKGFGIIQT